MTQKLKKLLFTRNGHNCRKLQPIKKKGVEPSLQVCICKARLREHLLKRGKKGYKSQEIRESTLSARNIRIIWRTEYPMTKNINTKSTPINSHQHHCPKLN